MKLGIDFGTTRVVVAAADRGNFPVIAFDDRQGEVHEWFPPLVAANADRVLYGWGAYAAQGAPEFTVVRSLKRLLREAGPGSLVELGPRLLPIEELLTGIAQNLLRSLQERSRLPGARQDHPEIVLGIPANANNNQRFLTADAFRRAGFRVEALLHEPSAAAIEFSHAFKNRSGMVAVYDLGGGTFDVSLVEAAEGEYRVLASEGIAELGGDDFDRILADLALERAGISFLELTQSESFRLLEECRIRKEALHPNSRRIPVALDEVRAGWPEVVVPVAEFYERAKPLAEQTLSVLEALLSRHDPQFRVDAIYVTGGGSELPLIARLLRERYGRKVRRSPYARASTAIGLAIYAQSHGTYRLRERFTRNFGVWREADEGRGVSFDVLFRKGTELPSRQGPALEIRRRYCAMHNIGHFRFLETSQLTPDGQPAGDITVWDEIWFPFDPGLKDRQDLSAAEVRRLQGPVAEIEEQYSCSAEGSVSVVIRNLSAGYERSYALGRWSGKAQARKASGKS